MIHKQQGAALIIAMLMLVLLTAIGVALMQTSSQDLKMADAAAEKKMITNMLEGAVDETIFQSGMSNTISNLNNDISFSSSTFDNANGVMSDRGEFDCKRSFNGSSTNVMTSCKYVDLEITSTYGKGGIAQAAIAAGIEQAIINGNQ